MTISRPLETSANGTRSAIWREGIKLFLAHPLAVTNNAISVKVFYGVPDYEYRNLHNEYLTLLAASGSSALLSSLCSASGFSSKHYAASPSAMTKQKVCCFPF